MRPAISSREILLSAPLLSASPILPRHPDFAASTMTGYNTRLRAPAQLKL
jgi:hypothetical protein